ncbi:hypothetical protein KQI65_11145 [bacterium]|nr:hypothetical protein [bacterium]
MAGETGKPQSPLSLQRKYLMQAVVVIIVTGLTIYILSQLLPFAIEGRYFHSSEIYFLATIANLVFFHTLAYHIIEETPRRVLLGTALTTLITSLMMYGVYYVYSLTL